MGCQLGCPHDRWNRPGTVSFVTNFERVCEAHGKSWHDLHAEIGCVIVVDDDRDIWGVLGHPLLGEVVAGEHRLPVVLFGAPPVDRNPHSGHVTGGDSCGYPCHYFSSRSFFERQPSMLRPPASIIAWYSGTSI